MKRYDDEDEAMQSMLRMMAVAGSLISTGALGYRRSSVRADMKRTRELAGNFGLNADTGYELVTAADLEVDVWMAKVPEKERPKIDEWTRRAGVIASWLADPSVQDEAHRITQIPITDPDREAANLAHPLAAGYAACARAAAVVTLLPDSKQRIDELVKRTITPFTNRRP